MADLPRRCRECGCQGFPHPDDRCSGCGSDLAATAAGEAHRAGRGGGGDASEWEANRG